MNYEEAEQYLIDNFPYIIDIDDVFIDIYWNKLNKIMSEIFGECCIDINQLEEMANIKNKNARWDYWGDYIFFKSEDDLIEFKLRFL